MIDLFAIKTFVGECTDAQAATFTDALKQVLSAVADMTGRIPWVDIAYHTYVNGESVAIYCRPLLEQIR